MKNFQRMAVLLTIALCLAIEGSREIYDWFEKTVLGKPVEYRRLTYGSLWRYFAATGVRLGDLVLVEGEKYFVTCALYQSGYLNQCVVPIGFTPWLIPQMVSSFNKDRLKNLKVLGHYAPETLNRRLGELKKKTVLAAGKMSSFK